jgi:uncharacterized protein
MKDSQLFEIDGRRLYYTFIAGARKVLENQQYLNRINVFPVKDGDTGSNMAVTIAPVISSVHPHRSFTVVANSIAESALVNACGNSGIIFAQFLYGMSREVSDYSSVTVPQFAASIRNSVPYMYEAVAHPVEGTILTVIREWADFIYSQSNIITDFNHLFIRSKEVLSKSLEETKQKLIVLARSNVVDAGANAFVLFIEGINELISEDSIRKILRTRPESVILPSNDEHVPQEITFRYCTEGILKNLQVDQRSLSALLQHYGDSVVIGGNTNEKHIHVHTNTPADLFHSLRDISLVTFQKADDMQRQNEVIYNRKWRIAIVTDSTCDLPAELIDHYQINIAPLNISFGESHYLDKITLSPDHFYSLLDEQKEFPKTSQVNENSFLQLYSHLAARYDSVIAIHLTEKFSGTFYNSYKAAQMVSEKFSKPISVINSKSLSGSLGLITLRAAMAIEEGRSHDEIVSLIGKWVKDTRIFVSVKTLKYMVRGGRVSYIKGLLARMLKINPVVSMDENGNSFVFGKAYSQLSNMKMVMDHINKITSGHEIWNYIILHAQNTKAASWYAGRMTELTGKEPVGIVNISPVIAGNAGIGAASVAFMFN